MDGRYLTIYWRCIKTSFSTNLIVEYHYVYCPTLDGHLTNKLYVDGSIATAVATETASILADDNSLYWFKFFNIRQTGTKHHE
jgi:hypothetical protein